MKPLDTVYDMCRYYIFDQTDVDTSLKDLVLGYLRARSLEDLSTCSRHYDWHGHSVVEWRFLRQIEAFFKKNALFADTKRCFEAAANSFIVNERNCSETNLRIKRFMYDKTPFELKYRIWTSLAQRYIQTVLGDYHSFTDDLPSLVKVTSGASSQHKRAESLPHLKMTMRPFCTERARKYLFAVYHKLDTQVWIFRTVSPTVLSLYRRIGRRIERSRASQKEIYPSSLHLIRTPKGACALSALIYGTNLQTKS